jgi:hypothetical protein
VQISSRFWWPNTKIMRSGNRTLAFVTCAIAFAFLCAGSAGAQSLSRWALGHPSVLIDLPGEPHAGPVAWTERPGYSILPNSWIAEGSGVRVEVARVYGRQSVTDVLNGIGKKLLIESAAQGSREVSGRPFVGLKSSNRMVAVAGLEPGIAEGATWAFVLSFNAAGGSALADQILNSVLIEREGRQNWTLRSLGRTSLCAELPFEMTPAARGPEKETETRYELNFEGMEVRVLQQEQGAGGRFDVEKTINDIVAENRGRPGVTDFVLDRHKNKIGDRQQAELMIMTFRRGSREYKIFESLVVAGTTAIIASVTIDPRLPQHTRVADRILDTMRFSGAVIYGWKPYPIGATGLYLDLPKAPEPPRLVNGSMTSGVFTGPMAVDVREVTSTAYNPEFAGRQMLEILKAWPGHKDVQGTIEKRLIDGLEARLLRTTHKNGSFINHRDMLLIYSFDRFWAIDAIAAENDKDYLERIINSAAVRLPVAAGLKRQQIGQLGVSLLVGPSTLETGKKETPNDSFIVMNEMAGTNLGAGALIVVEMTYKNDSPPLQPELGLDAVGGLLKTLSEAVGEKLSSKLRDSFPLNLDGTEGLHLVLDLSNGSKTVQGDFVMLREGKRWWTAFVMTDPSREESRLARAQVLNGIRIGR